MRIHIVEDEIRIRLFLRGRVGMGTKLCGTGGIKIQSVEMGKWGCVSRTALYCILSPTVSMNLIEKQTVAHIIVDVSG